MSEIDPIEFGKLLQSVKTLTSNVEILTTQVTELQQTLTGGKGIVIGMMIAAGGVGAMASKVVESIFK